MVLGEYAWILENEYGRAALILIVSGLIAKLFQMVFEGIFKKITEKTETDLDDIILKISARPIFYLILLVGAWLAIHPLTILTNHPTLRDGIFFVVTVLLVSWMISRVFVLLSTRWFVSHRNLKGSPKLINIIVASIVYLAAGIVILSFFNVEVTPLVAALGVGGLAIGLALQDTLGNIFAGIHIISDEPIRVHDIVEIKGEDVVGEVADIGWRSTRIKTFKGNSVVVPNSKLANSILINYELPESPMKVSIECGVDYSSDLYKVEQVTLNVAKELQKNHNGAVESFDPVFRFFQFGDSNVNFRVILEAKTRGDTFLIHHDFIKALHARFDKEHIEISWPVRKQYALGKPEGKKIYKKVPKMKRSKKEEKKSKRKKLEGSFDE